MFQHLLRPLVTACIAYGTHYTATSFYTAFCIPDGFSGFLQGVFTTASPVCASTLNVMTATQVTYGSIVTYMIGHLLVDTFMPLERHKEPKQQQAEETDA